MNAITANSARRSFFAADSLPPPALPRGALPTAALRGRARSLDLVERPGQQRAHRIGAAEVEPRVLLRHPLHVPIEPGEQAVGQAECDLRGGFLGHVGFFLDALE